MRKRKVVILGATGSIGESAAKVASDIPDRMEIVGISGNRNVERLAQQANKFRPGAVCISDRGLEAKLRAGLEYKPEILLGEEGLVALAMLDEADMALIAIVGTGGLRPALAAIEAGKDLAVASKEILVMAGEIVMTRARRRGVHVLPVDSEHNAIFQCLEHQSSEDVSRLILTASGGPFRNLPKDKFAEVQPAQALKHPTWDMGAKITIDSATLFNKGLEMIEARWLFDVEMQRVDVIVHPQSIVHSMVEFVDGSVLAQLSNTDMCFPIQYAVTWPERVPNTLRPLDFAQLAKLEFEAPRYRDFPALNLARKAGETGGALPAVLNAANEVAVAAFLEDRIRFPEIWEVVERVMEAQTGSGASDLDAILAADKVAREMAVDLCGAISN